MIEPHCAREDVVRAAFPQTPYLRNRGSEATMTRANDELTMRAREEDYEVALPGHWAKRELPDGNWILHSTKGPESLRVRVLLPVDGEPLEEPERGARAAAEGLTSAMTSHVVHDSGWDGETFSITGTGSSRPEKALLAFRVLADKRKLVWALHEVSLSAASDADRVLEAPPEAELERERLAILASLSLR
jgi:hypothetical protein